MTLTLSDILHIRQVQVQVGSQDEIAGVLTPAQQTKVNAIEALLVEIGTPTIDEELDSMIVALTEIRDRP
jgi:hypothetical protein